MASRRSPPTVSNARRYVSWLAPPESRSQERSERNPGTRSLRTRERLRSRSAAESPAIIRSSRPRRGSFFRDAFWCALLHEAEHVAGDPPRLDLFGALGDAVAAVVAIDVLEGLVAGVAETAVDLHGAIRRLAAHAVRPEVAHRHLVGRGELPLRVH